MYIKEEGGLFDRTVPEEAKVVLLLDAQPLLLLLFRLLPPLPLEFQKFLVLHLHLLHQLVPVGRPFVSNRNLLEDLPDLRVALLAEQKARTFEEAEKGEGEGEEPDDSETAEALSPGGWGGSRGRGETWEFLPTPW